MAGLWVAQGILSVRGVSVWEPSISGLLPALYSQGQSRLLRPVGWKQGMLGSSRSCILLHVSLSLCKQRGGFSG